MDKSKRATRIAAAALAAALLLGGAAGTAVAVNKNKKPVPVIPLEEIAQTDMWMDRTQYDGTVRAENLQTLVLSETMQLREVYVKEGDAVKKGDRLAAFDTTLSELELERARIGVKKLELRLENAKRDLAAANALRPYTPPAPQPEPEPETPPLEPAEVPLLLGGDGGEESPFVYLWDDTCRCDTDFVNGILPPAAEVPAGAEGEEPAVPAQPAQVWVVFQTRENNSPQGAPTGAVGAVLCREATGGWSLGFFPPDPSFTEEEPAAPAQPEVPEEPEAPAYTAADIARMRDEARQTVRETETALKTERLKLKKLELELDSGLVTARLDGVVKSVVPEAEARAENKPVLTVSAGGAWTVEANVGELDLENISVGDPVEVESWMDGGSLYEGTVTAISRDPAADGWYNGSGNPNVSYYPVTVEVPAEAALQDGDYVSVTFGGAAQGGGLYLEAPFIRRDGGRSYVYAAGEDGRLERREIRTGKLLWGSTVEIKAGLDLTDAIAFPYGKNVKPGAKTELTDASSLYEEWYE